jgi:peptidoglycan/LPS O-acetylase OafA/YrhL
MALLAIFIACKYTIRKYKMVFNIVCALVCLDALFQVHIIGKGENPEHSLLPISFALGVFLSVNQDYIKISYKVVMLFSIITAFCWRISIINEVFFNATVSFILLLLAANKHVLKLSIKYDISYGLYLWGFVVQQTIYHLCGALPFLVFVVLSLFFTAIMAYISYVYVERKGIDFGRRLDAYIKLHFSFGAANKSVVV